MNRLAPRLALSVVAGFFALLGPGAGGAIAPYHLLKAIPIGGDGGWDYLSLDTGAHRLYVTHARQIAVIGLDAATVVGAITNTPGVHGFALAPDLRRGFASNGRDATVSIVDLPTLRTIAKVPTGENPDAILYEPRRQEVYVFNGRSRSATVFAASSGQVVATIPLPGKPEFAVADPAAGQVYCNIEDHDAVVALATGEHRIVQTWATAPGTEPAGLAIDPLHHRLFIGCHNKLLVVLDSTNGRVIATVPIGQGVDANAFDPATALVFSSCGDGTVTVAHQQTPDKYPVIQTLTTERGARTMALDPQTHRIYLATARFAPPPEPVPGAPRPRPAIVPGSLRILVYDFLGGAGGITSR